MTRLFQTFKAASKNLIRYNHFLRALVTLMMTDYRFPSVLGIDVASICNLRCSMCAAHQMRKGAGIMSLELFSRILDESLEYGRRWMIILHNFGEPLLNPELPRMVTMIKEKKAAQVVQFATNGLLLTEDIIGGLIDAGLDSVTISVDAHTADDYRELKGVDGLEKVRENSRLLMKLKKERHSPLPWVSAKMVRRKGREGAFKPFLKEWRALVDEALLTPYSNWGGDVPYEGTDILPPRRHACHFLWYYPVIDWQGQVYMCCATVSDKGVIGDLRETTLQQIWTGERLKSLRRAHLSHDLSCYPACSDCSYWAESKISLDCFLKP
jgi:radical SAM protein with 4Fe4S-binding SPASM domain